VLPLVVRGTAVALLVAGLAVVPARGQSPTRLQAPTDAQIVLSDIEVGRLVPLLRLEPGMTIADVGAGLGAWSLRFSQRTGASGRVYATDIDDTALAALRTFVAREKLSNVTVLAGAAASTNLPAGCCDAILLRNVFHYVTEPAAMIRSLAASLKPGGRLAIADFPPRPNTTVPAGVPANRGGVGIPPAVVESEIGALLTHVTTVPNWAPEGMPPGLPPGILPPYVVIFEKPR
jgi:SAM-dependent methyltransferase